MEFQYKTVVKRTYADIVAKQIKRMIINGELKTGDRLPTEQELAEMFGVGRTTIREAIKELCAVGLIQRNKQATFVKNISNMCFEPVQNIILLNNLDIAQIFEARMALELSLCNLAAYRHTDEDMEIILAYQREMSNPDLTIDSYSEANFNFHLAIARASKNILITDLLLTMVQILKEKQKEIMYLPGIRESILCEHEAIIEAIKARETDQAVESMKIHLKKALKNHLRYLNEL